MVSLIVFKVKNNDTTDQKVNFEQIELRVLIANYEHIMKSSEYMWCVTPNVNCNIHPNHKFLFLDTTETLAPSPVLAPSPS